MTYDNLLLLFFVSPMTIDFRHERYKIRPPNIMYHVRFLIVLHFRQDKVSSVDSAGDVMITDVGVEVANVDRIDSNELRSMDAP